MISSSSTSIHYATSSTPLPSYARTSTSTATAVESSTSGQSAQTVLHRAPTPAATAIPLVKGNTPGLQPESYLARFMTGGDAAPSQTPSSKRRQSSISVPPSSASASTSTSASAGQQSSTTPTVSRQVSLHQAFSNSAKRQRTSSAGTPSDTTAKPIMIDLTKTPQRLPSNQFSTGKTTVRKLTIRNLSLGTTADKEREDKYYAETLDKLSGAMDAIFQGAPELQGMQELYRGGENLVRGKRSQQLLDLALAKMETAARQLLSAVLVKIAKGDAAAEVISAAWISWNAQISMLRNVLFYLDRTFLLNGATGGPRKCLPERGHDMFHSCVLTNADVISAFHANLIALFQEDRLANRVRGPNDKILADSMAALRVTETYPAFEALFVEETRKYYVQLQTTLRDSTDVNAIMDTASRALQQEEERSNAYFVPTTLTQVIAIVETTLISELQKELLAGTDKYLASLDGKSLHHLRSLLAKQNLLAELREAISDYIKRRGLAIVQGDEAVMVEQLLELKSSMDGVVRSAFESGVEEDVVSSCVRDPFASFVNARGDVPAEMMAKYMDGVLKTGNRRYTDAELEQKMAELMDIFRFIASKDVFEAFYKKDLAKRLLLNKSASADAERSLLLKLRTECGPQFTSKLEGMFKDIELSRGFDKHLAFAEKSSLDVMVLSQGSWPSYPEVPARLPESMARELEQFQQAYLKSQSGRKLMWRHSLGHCQIKASFPKGDKELMVSLFQGLVLMCFNEGDGRAPLSYDALQKQTGLEDKELERTLQSLACGKPETRVLVKNSRGKEIGHKDMFKVNEQFSSPKKVVKINQIQLKETKEEQAQTRDRIVQDRSFEIQAAIVRIMKAAKKLTHQQLTADTIAAIQGRGLPNVQDIKKAIEKLIEREYLSRHGKEYHYEA
ncbi:hypothetical protein PYCC9005_004766 [Savitreella phatthalungensis]